MKKISLLLILCLLALNMPAVQIFAAEGGKKGASEKALERASEDSVFNRMGDWFATIGKSDEEKAAIKAERREKRRIKREKKRAEKEAKRAEKETKKAQKDAKKGAGKLKKKLKNK